MKSTAQLLEIAATGEADAIDRLLDQHRDQLRRMVVRRIDRRLAARVDASDVVQDALIEAAQRLTEYLCDRPVAFYPWLRRIAMERLVDLFHLHVTAQKRTVNRETSNAKLSRLSTVKSLPNEIVETPSGYLADQESQERLRLGLELLSPKDREVLVLRDIRQHSVAEVACILSVSEGAVKMRRLRAILRLRQLIGSQ